MKIRLLFGLWAILIAGLISVQADDTPAQAAARTALEQKLRELENPQTTNTVANAEPPQPGQPTTNDAAVLPITEAVSQTARPKAPAKIKPAVPPAKPGPASATTISPVTAASTNQIVTSDGSIYKNANVEEVDSDGIVISYTLADGGLGMCKIYFNELPAAARQAYQKN